MEVLEAAASRCRYLLAEFDPGGGGGDCRYLSQSLISLSRVSSLGRFDSVFVLASIRIKGWPSGVSAAASNSPNSTLNCDRGYP